LEYVRPRRTVRRVVARLWESYTEPDAELRLLLDKLKLALPAQSPPKITTAQIAPRPPP
jgi:hypothetical protein